MIGSVLTLWLQEEGLSRSQIGYAGAIFIAYSINFLWSPLVDRIKFGFLGDRKGWIFITQALMIAGCIGNSFCSPKTSLTFLMLFSILIAFASATQDVAIDALRIDLFSEKETEKLSAAAATATSGWWTGYAGLGFLPLWLSDATSLGWQKIYLVLAGVMFFLMLLIEFSIREKTDRKVTAFTRKVNPVKNFFQKNGFRLAVSILLFVFLFKIGEAFLGKMSIVFYKELGFTNTDIGFYSKLLSWWVTIVFSLIGGAISIKYGIVRGLIIAGLAMAGSNIMFSLMAYVGPNKNLFALTIIIDGFTSAWSTVAFVAFLSLLCDRTFTASQYALLASLGTLSRTLLSSLSGKMVDMLGGNWSLFFVITALMVLPSLLVLESISEDISKIEQDK